MNKRLHRVFWDNIICITFWWEGIWQRERKMAGGGFLGCVLPDRDIVSNVFKHSLALFKSPCGGGVTKTGLVTL